MANGLVVVRADLPAALHHEVVKLNVLEITDLVEGICGGPWVNCPANHMFRVKRVGLRFFAFDFLSLLLSLLFALNALGFFVLLCQPVSVFLFKAVLFKLGIPGNYLAVVLPCPGLLHALCGIFYCEGNIPYMCVDHGLSEEVPVSAFKGWAYCPGGVFDNMWHLLDKQLAKMKISAVRGKDFV